MIKVSPDVFNKHWEGVGPLLLYVFYILGKNYAIYFIIKRIVTISCLKNWYKYLKESGNKQKSDLYLFMESL